MKSKVLYKRTTNGGIQTWQIHAEENRFWTIEGLLNGTLTTSLPTYCQGKNPGRRNETTAEAQAQKEAESRYKKKIKEGYTPDVNNIDVAAEAFYKPMLAKKWQDRKHKVQYPVFSQPKLDGIRCIATKDGLWSRNGERHKSVPHIEAFLQEFFRRNPEAILDGELYADKYNNDFNELSSIIMKGIQGNKPVTPEDLAKSAECIEYWVYDYPSAPGNFSSRLHELQRVFGTNFNNMISMESPIRGVLTVWLQDEAKVIEYFEKYLDEGYEGQIIRVDGPYENKRSWNLLKHKSFEDAEWVILGLIEGKGNRAGTVGKMCFQTFDGEPFDSNVKGPHTWLRKLWNERDSLIGKKATIRYPNLTPSGKPRFPFVTRIRDYE